MLGYGPEGRAHYALMAVTLDFVFPPFMADFCAPLSFYRCRFQSRARARFAGRCLASPFAVAAGFVSGG